MWKNGSTYFASFDQNCGFCSPGSGAWIHSSLHPLGPYTLQRNINRHLLPGCLPSDRPAAVNGKCGRGGYNYRNGEAITATADLGKEENPGLATTTSRAMASKECWKNLDGNYRGAL
jgi:hypothetical protein